MEEIIITLFIISLVSAIKNRHRLSFNSVKLINYAIFIGFYISVSGFFIFSQVYDISAFRGVELVAWTLGLIMIASTLAIPYAVSGFVSARHRTN